MQQTERLKLNLIEQTDVVDPQPINENMEILEGELADLRQSFPVKHMALGVYSGNGGSQTIELEFTPAAVLVFNRSLNAQTANQAAFAVADGPAYVRTTVGLEIVANGFAVTQEAANNNGVNLSSTKFHYLALG